ncbi:hypothetical protein DdX_19403 [Ditylenchus destructor]|uniref:Uncharacterized protein n=1 Tax=Ditylenchus destructor TaxID=166010 RepID=A0AAD4MJQ6_9BILA|nr:hypothetical protein DdX_19403 [Ditylenchus destructor]
MVISQQPPDEKMFCKRRPTYSRSRHQRIRPIYDEQIHMQKNDEIKEHGITNQSPPKYAIHIHLNVRSDKVNITLKLLHQPTNT